MGRLLDLFQGRTRIRVLEALLRLAPVEFNRSELAEEAEISRSSSRRPLPELLEMGVIREVKGGRAPIYVVDDEKPLIRGLHSFESFLGLIEEHPEGAVAEDAVEVLSRTLSQIAMQRTPSISYSEVVELDTRSHARYKIERIDLGKTEIMGASVP